ncbi:MAG: cation transporter [Vicinamibacterales bacterium]
MAAMMAPDSDRPVLVRRGQWLNAATLAYNSLEGLLAIVLGLNAGSVALFSFGIDSAIEVSASIVALWRLDVDVDPLRRARVERISHRTIGSLFLGIALYIAGDGVNALFRHRGPETSVWGIVLAAASLVVMPYLAREKRRIGLALGSRALVSESGQTSLCTYLSAILLAGLLLNALVGWWWSDPVAALLMVPIIVREGIQGLRGDPACHDGCH